MKSNSLIYSESISRIKGMPDYIINDNIYACIRINALQKGFNCEMKLPLLLLDANEMCIS